MIKDRVLSISVIFVFILLYLETFNFKKATAAQIVGPAAYPRFLIYIILLLSTVVLINSFLKKKENNSSKSIFYWGTFINKHKRIFLIFVFFGLFVFIMSKFNFIVASIFFLFSSQTLLMEFKIKNITLNIFTSIVITLIVYLVFTNFLSIILP